MGYQRHDCLLNVNLSTGSTVGVILSIIFSLTAIEAGLKLLFLARKNFMSALYRLCRALQIEGSNT